MGLWKIEEHMLRHMLNFHQLAVIFLSLIGNQIHMGYIWNNKEKKQNKREKSNYNYMETCLFIRNRIFKSYLNISQLSNQQMAQISRQPQLFMARTILMKPQNLKY